MAAPQTNDADQFREGGQPDPPPQTSVQKQSHDLEPTRQSLLLRLKDWEDQKSWLDFFSRYWRFMYGVARRSGLSDAEAQDVVQETLVIVCKSIGTFQYQPERCSFRSWLTLLCRQRIIAAWRKRKARPQFDALSAEVAVDVSEPELDAIWAEEWEANLVSIAAEVVKRQVKPKQFQIYDLHVLQHWPVTRVKETLKVSTTQVYLAKHRVGRLMRREIRRLEKNDSGR